MEYIGGLYDFRCGRASLRHCSSGYALRDDNLRYMQSWDHPAFTSRHRDLLAFPD